MQIANLPCIDVGVPLSAVCCHWINWSFVQDLTIKSYTTFKCAASSFEWYEQAEIYTGPVKIELEAMSEIYNYRIRDQKCQSIIPRVIAVSPPQLFVLFVQLRLD